jgi:glycoside/pentoside/hexuronide:cation symporter, GPH family
MGEAPVVAPAARSSSTPADERVRFPVIFAYGVPRLGFGLVAVVLATYLAKYGTDVLLITPIAMGAIQALSRIWDGVTDPLVGYWSDRTRTRMGRRRPWMLAAALPMMAGFVMLWSPPLGLSGLETAFWVGIGYLLYETAESMFLIPHSALGVELTLDYHERTRLFAWRHIFMATGTLLGLAALFRLSRAEEPRAMAELFSIFGGGALAAMIAYAAWKLPERQEFQGRGTVKISKAFFDVFRNPHSRLLMLADGIEHLGAASIATLTPFVTQYVLGQPELFTRILVVYLAPQALLTPLWIVMARRLDKKKLWLGSMCTSVVAFTTMFFFSPGMPVVLIYSVALVLGLSAGVAAVSSPAIHADIIDYDEYLTGERKEGSYLAMWNLVRKLASAVTPFLALTSLELSGYVANQEQNETTKSVLLFFYGLFPALCYATGTVIFLRFSLNRTEHARIRAELRARSTARLS